MERRRCNKKKKKMETWTVGLHLKVRETEEQWNRKEGRLV
jgi:hypothetical protein